MADVRNYDFKKVLCIVGGVQMQAFMDGDDSIMVEADADAFNLQVGADGEATRSRNNNNAGKLTLKLMGTSPSNDVLSGYHLADKLTGKSTVPFLIKDGLGNTLVAAEKAWIVKVPNIGFGVGIGAREWVLQTHDIAITAGGGQV